MGLVYTIRNTINDKCYVGLTTRDNYNDRLKEHVSFSKSKSKYHIHRAIRKYGWENFTHTAWYVSDDIVMLSRFEIAKIKEFDTFNNGYNMTEGGESPPNQKGYKHTKESRKKNSKSHKGMLPWNTGRKRSPFSKEWKRKLGFKGTKNPRAKEIILIHPDGVEEYFDYMGAACRKYNLNHSSLCWTIKNNRIHKGFKCRYYKENS